MRVLFVASEVAGTATYRYRSENLARCLRRAGHEAEVVYVGQSRVKVDADVVVLHRICMVPEGIAFARAVRKTGGVLVYSTDDTVFSAESFPSYGEPWGRIRAFAPSHAEMLVEADAVLVSTEHLKNEVTRTFGPDKPVFTVRNFLANDLLQLSEQAARTAPPKDGKTITLGYMSGTATHNRDIPVASGALNELLTTRDHLRLLLVGPLALESDLARIEQYGKITRAPFVPWNKLPEVIAQTDINLAPLNLNFSFVRSKSEIKFLEAAAAGVPTIATATEGFTEAVSPNAITYCRDNQHWQRNLEWLLDPDYRHEQVARAYEHVVTKGCEEAVWQLVADTFALIAAVPRKGNGDTAIRDRNVWVNYPFAPPKYLAKAVLRKLGH